jgi:adiponectin receptor
MGPRFRVYRTALFTALGGSGLFPMMHLVIKQGFMYTRYAASFDYVICMGLMYVLGGCLYASRIPERWFPGKFDLWLHSHQIFHLLVVGAALVHYKGTMAALKFRHTHLSTCDIERTWLLQSVY